MKIVKCLMIAIIPLLGCQNKIFRIGEYDVTHQNLNYSIELWKDSSFRYIKRYEWPIEATLGHWKIEQRKLILNSVPDTSSRILQALNPYILFNNKALIIKRNRLIELDNPHL